MFTPSSSTVFPALCTRPVSETFLRSIAAAPRPIPLFLDSAGSWTTTPGPTATVYKISDESYSILILGGTPSRLGEGWTAASGIVYRLVAVQDIAGARHGVVVAAGPTDPPVT